MRLLFFGKLGDIADAREREQALPAGAGTVRDLIDAIAAEDEALGAALRDASIRYAVNAVVCSADAAISDHDEVAFLPPVSGG